MIMIILVSLEQSSECGPREGAGVKIRDLYKSPENIIVHMF